MFKTVEFLPFPYTFKMSLKIIFVDIVLNINGESGTLIYMNELAALNNISLTQGS